VTPASSVVLDASVAVRAFADDDGAALAWFQRVDSGETEAAWPELALIEVANALVTLVRAGRMQRERAAEVLAATLAAPVRSERLDLLVEAALPIAMTRSLSVYDACYVVLAETMGATLVTADRKLAGGTPSSVFLTA
jgi:predicted nucleic acid-binding protein